MTWIIGRATPFGNSIGISDIQITLNDGTTIDCLQKIYKIGNQMALGFAGSVAIGLENVYQITTALNIKSPKQMWDPRKIAETLPYGAKKLFNSFSQEEQDLGCQLLLLGVHPNENDGPSPWAKCYVYKFSSPDFEPIRSNGVEIVSIGSGSGIKKYVDALDRLSHDFDMFKLETGTPGGSGLGLMTSISSVLNGNPQPGISQHVHICIVGRDGVRLGTNIVKDPDNPEKNKPMPNLATNMDELQKMISDFCNQSIAGAKA
ncbi:MAG: hypothetical protein GYA12_15275 [Chloroflexi bacterium]|nr:hypothetical protein [Chloroflexota bacterium]BCY17361.1 hypothetical protein hrd7_12100 [Leptolinea sp. HRD-7]